MTWANNLAAAATAALCSISITANAQLTQNLSIGNARAIALGNSVTADPPGIDSIHYNPAGLVRLSGQQMHTNIFVASMSLEADFGRHSEDFEYTAQFNGLSPESDPVRMSHSQSSGPAVMLPIFGLDETPVLGAVTGGFSYSPIGSNWTIATTVYTPDAAGYSRGKDDPGRYNGREVSLTRLTYLSPSIGYRFNDQLSVGLSLGLSYQGIGMELDMRAPNIVVLGLQTISEAGCVEGDTECLDAVLGVFDDIGTLRFEVEDRLSPTVNLGVLWEPNPWLALGAVYRTEAKMTLKGNYTYRYSEKWQASWQKIRGDLGEDLANVAASLGVDLPRGAVADTGEMEFKQTHPASLALGASMMVTPRLKVNLDYKWVEYSSWESFQMEFDRALDFLRITALLSSNATTNQLTLPREYNDIGNFSIGFEYQYNDRLQLRFGYDQRKSPIPTDRQDVLLPFGDGRLIGMGAGYRWSESQVIDVGIGWLSADTNIPAGESPNVNYADWDNLVYNPYAGLEIDTSITAFLVEATYKKVF